LALDGVGGEIPIAFKSPHTYYKAVTGGSVDSRFLCGDAAGAKIPVAREVKGGRTYPPYDYADSFGCRPADASGDRL